MLMDSEYRHAWEWDCGNPVESAGMETNVVGILRGWTNVAWDSHENVVVFCFIQFQMRMHSSFNCHDNADFTVILV